MRTHRRLRSAAGAALTALALGCVVDGERAPEIEPAPPAPDAYTEQRQACAHRDPLRQAWFGELHVHSKLSMDAVLFEVRGTPDDVYRYARGGAIDLPPYDENGRATRRSQLARSLDFAALTDHASFMAEVSLCTREGSAAWDSTPCRIFRGEREAAPGLDGFQAFGARLGAIAGATLTPEGELDTSAMRRGPAVCGEDGARCMAELASVWQQSQKVTERWYDKTDACEFTTFHAYEYTATPDFAKVHRNVIFRNAVVPDVPIAYVDQPDVVGLWRDLEQQCLEAGRGCDVLTIPHNSNLSNGRMFTVDYAGLPADEQRVRAMLQQELEPLVEIMQIKGDSECRNGVAGVMGAADEFCDFEKWRPRGTPDCADGEVGRGALVDEGCQSRVDFVRYALIEGLREGARIGINPYKLGIIASTDAHNANPGDADEAGYDGWSGLDSDLSRRLVAGSTGLEGIRANPGGLVGVWSEENSRDALFDAMERRETFGTSGPRMTARFFGGWNLPGDLCDSDSLVATGYAEGVPMGGNLPTRPPDALAPRFAVSALRDAGVPGRPGGALARAQIIKGWVGDDGQFHQEIHDVAGGANDADVDLETCAPRGRGHDALCSVWTDPSFDPDRSAVYYVRVLENPSCRWNQRQCVAANADTRPAACDDPDVPRVIQERLWTSPIWYEPERL
jgi:hypothetical protein